MSGPVVKNGRTRTQTHFRVSMRVGMMTALTSIIAWNVVGDKQIPVTRAYRTMPLRSILTLELRESFLSLVALN